MKRKMMFTIISVLSLSAGFTQNKIKFHTINNVGIAAGKSGGFGILQTINGLGYKKWFAGGGLGIDYYKYKSIPLFLDLRTSIATTNLFVFGDIGYNFSSQNKPGKEIHYYSTYHFTGGLYHELGLGYKIPLARKNYLLFSSGYSYKEVNNTIGVVNQCLVAPCSVDYSKYKYGYGRIAVKAGVSF